MNNSFFSNKKSMIYLLLLLLTVFMFGLTACGGSSSKKKSTGNTAPTASDSDINVAQDGSVSGTLTGSDTDGDSLTFQIVGNATKGDATITDSATGAFTYTAHSGETGADSFTFNCNDGTVDSNTATVSVTINPKPTADAGADATADELSTVALSGSGTGSGTLTMVWSQVIAGSEPAVTITDNGDGTASFIAPAVNMATLLTFKLEVTDNASQTAEDEVVITVSDAGILLGSLAASPDLVNDIDAEGTMDWTHWGYSDAAVKNLKESPPVSLIDDYSPEPDSLSLSPGRWDDSPIAFTWPAGTGWPIDNAAKTTGFISFLISSFSQGQGIKLEVPADTTARTLKLYIGTTSAKANVTATLSDGSAADYTTTIDNPVSLSRAQVVTLNYAAASAGQTLTVKFTFDTDTGASGGSLNLYAATLAEDILPTPVISLDPGGSAGELQATLTAETDIPAGAVVRYETGQSPADPTENSSLYSGPIALSQSGTIKAKAFFPGYTNGRVASIDYSAASGTSTSGISAFIEQAPSSVADINAEGTEDWTHWGYSDAAIKNVKESPPVSLIDDYSPVPDSLSLIPGRWDDSPIAFTWPAGTGWPTDNAANTTGFISFMIGSFTSGQGIQLEVPADETTRTLKIYLSTTSASANVTATLSDGSVAPYTETIDNTVSLARAKVVTLNYAAAADSQTLTVEFTYDSDTGSSGGALNLHAATLQ